MQEHAHDARFDPPGETRAPGASASRRAAQVLTLLLLSSYAVTDYLRSTRGPRWFVVLAGIFGFALAILQVVLHLRADNDVDGTGPYTRPPSITR